MCLFVNRLRSEDFIQENRLRYSLIHIGGLLAIELWNIKDKLCGTERINYAGLSRSTERVTCHLKFA